MKHVFNCLSVNILEGNRISLGEGGRGTHLANIIILFLDSLRMQK